MTRGIEEAHLRARLVHRITLATWPTPLEELTRLRTVLGCASRLFVKRDDAASFGMGGTKVRMLELLASEARAAGADVLVTCGTAKSNCARLVGSLAARLGMECVLVLSGPRPAYASDNLLLCELLGARIHWVASREERAAATDAVVRHLKAAGRVPFVIPLSAATTSATLAVAGGMLEALDQSPMIPDVIVVSSSEGATQAGLLLGGAVRGVPTRVIGISPDDPADAVRGRVRTLLKTAASAIGFGRAVNEPVVEVDDTYADGAPGRDRRITEAITLLARTEGLFLDPVYTGAAAAALLDGLARGTFDGCHTVLLWHTGGLPALFAPRPRDRVDNQ
ncbi:MAG TPA: pyridoxal-phosphate dependent enzyme [Longimicrobium sp.]